MKASLIVTGLLGCVGLPYVGQKLQTAAMKDALNKVSVVIPDQFVRCETALGKYEAATRVGDDIMFNELLLNPQYNRSEKLVRYKPLTKEQELAYRAKHKGAIDEAEAAYRSRKNISPEKLPLFIPYSEAARNLMQCQRKLDQQRHFQEAINSQSGELYEKYLEALYRGIHIGSNIK